MTGREAWFRSRLWTPEIAQAFWARLARSRPGNRSQYLVLQALALLNSAEPGALEAALMLIQHHLAEFPPDIFRPEALEIRARCHERLGRVEEALADLRASANLQAAGARVVHTEADLDFAWLVATRGLSEHFDESIAHLDRHERANAQGISWPVSRFRLAAARALIAAQGGAVADARAWAREALDLAAVTSSGLRYHSNLGLVADSHAEVRARLANLAR